MPSSIFYKNGGFLFCFVLCLCSFRNGGFQHNTILQKGRVTSMGS